MTELKTEDIISLFRKENFRATPQRVAVYGYLCENKTHPNVLSIYESVKKQNPAFSKTTVYNAVSALAEKGLIVPVTIDGECVHYDADIKPHGHFYCEKCKRIYDFSAEMPRSEELSGFSITHKNVYYSGLCPCCKNK